eukprot:TRINITY_DN1009_c1_g1_i1.p1 TRINITY_DN1009_c1_g1~~TRINITY_DN1009_c1_g1_i1.p1  ORF type:complete len:154 (-),score=30.62 TRINITY_DN1009_c1_g1_i1:247-708(-)
MFAARAVTSRWKIAPWARFGAFGSAGVFFLTGFLSCLPGLGNIYIGIYAMIISIPTPFIEMPWKRIVGWPGFKQLHEMMYIRALVYFIIGIPGLFSDLTIIGSIAFMLDALAYGGAGFNHEKPPDPITFKCCERKSGGSEEKALADDESDAGV